MDIVILFSFKGDYIMENALQVIDPESKVPMTVDAVREQINLIQHLMKSVMKDGQHYGKIPNCGDKPTLLKAGAEKIGMIFRLRAIINPREDIIQTDLGKGHREYQIFTHIMSGRTEIATGCGVCSTMETKYRWRNENTGKEVPSEYWKTRDPDLIGGSQYSTRKMSGKWMIMHRVEHDNPADYYNTCLKIAKKRSHVDGIIQSTSASDIFTQDIEDMNIVNESENIPVDPVPQEKNQDKANDTRVISTPQANRLRAIAKKNGKSNNDVEQYILRYQYNSISEIQRSDYDEIVDWAENGSVRELEQNDSVPLDEDLPF